MFAFGVQYECPYEDKGEYTWSMTKYELILEHAVDVYLGKCTYPTIPIHSQPKIYFAVEKNGRGEEKDILEKFKRDVDRSIKNGRNHDSKNPR